MNGLLTLNLGSVKITEAHRRKVKRLAAKWKCSQSEVIRRLIEQATIN